MDENWHKTKFWHENLYFHRTACDIGSRFRELQEQPFVYVSLRIPNWGLQDSLTLSLRAIDSLTDHSSKGQISLDTFIGRNFMGSTGVTLSGASLDKELTRA